MKLGLVLLAGFAAARKRLVDEHGHDVKLESPHVEDCEEFCIFKDETNSWCVQLDSPILEIGWGYE
jgi:hypothetical protein